MTEYEAMTKVKQMQREIARIQNHLNQKDYRSLDQNNPEYVLIYLEQWLRDLAWLETYLK